MKYIVSLEIPLGSNDPKAYSHEAVKMAYKAGAVIEFFHTFENKWINVIDAPGFFADSKYRAIVTPDMPKEIQDLVNHQECQYIDYPPPGLITKPVFAQAIGRGKRTSLPKYEFRKQTEAERTGAPGGENAILADLKFIPAPQRHKWADVIISWANGESIQHSYKKQGWRDFIGVMPDFSNENHEWRIKPKTIMIGDTEVPAPETKAPVRDQEYFIADPLEETRLYKYYKFRNDEFDRHCLRSGMIHRTAQAAQEHALALIKVSGGQHPDSYEVAK